MGTRGLDPGGFPIHAEPFPRVEAEDAEDAEGGKTMTKGWALLALLAALVLLSSSPAAATDFIKVKEYDDAECTEDPARIQTALYPVDTCLIIGKQRMFLHSSNSSLQAFAPPEGRGGRGCVTAPILDEPVTVGDGECLNLDDTLHIKIESLFPEGTYQLSPEENVVNGFTVFCNDPDMTGFNYYGLYNQNQCYTYGLEDGASERFEIKKEENATKIVKTDYKS